MFYFYIPWEYQKISSFLMFPESVQMEHRIEIR